MSNERKRAKKKTPRQVEYVKRQKMIRLVEMLRPHCFLALQVDGSHLPERKQERIALKSATIAAAVLLDEIFPSTQD